MNNGNNNNNNNSHNNDNRHRRGSSAPRDVAAPRVGTVINNTPRLSAANFASTCHQPTQGLCLPTAQPHGSTVAPTLRPVTNAGTSGNATTNTYTPYRPNSSTFGRIRCY